MQTLTLQLRGAGPDENLELSVFAQQVSALESALTALDKEGGAPAGQGIELRVVNLSHASPARVTVAGYTAGGLPAGNAGALFGRFTTAVRELQGGVGSVLWPRPLLEALSKFAEGLRSGVKEILITHDGVEVSVSGTLGPSVEALLLSHVTYQSSLRGMLEYLNVHEGSNTFRVYPLVGPSYVTCRFPKELRNRVKAAMDRYVEVHGEFRQRHGEQFPYEAVVTDVLTQPDEANLPKMRELRGIAKSKGGESAEEMLERERHDEW